MRYTALGLALVGTAVCAALIAWSPAFILPALVCAGLSGVGLWDLLQPRHSLRRNYPILANIRFGLENDPTRDPPIFPRERPRWRALQSLQARGGLPARQGPARQATLRHSLRRLWRLRSSGSTTRSRRGRCAITISAFWSAATPAASLIAMSLLNISAMSFGALSANAIRALNRGAKLGGFAHDTGEGGFSRYHREFGGDIIWEIGSGYFGCRNEDGSFAPRPLRRGGAPTPQVKMIEIKLSQGAKPGHGGVLPGAKVTPEIAAARGVPEGVDCVSPASPFGLPHPPRDGAASSPSCASSPGQAGRIQALHRPSLGVHGDLQGNARDWHPSPISSSSTAPRAAPARRRWNSSTMSGRRCARAWSSPTTASSVPVCANTSGLAPAAASSRPSTWRASSR